MCGWSALDIPFVETRTTLMHGLRINPIHIQFLVSLPDMAMLAIRQLNSQKLEGLTRPERRHSGLLDHAHIHTCYSARQQHHLQGHEQGRGGAEMPPGAASISTLAALLGPDGGSGTCWVWEWVWEWVWVWVCI